MAPTGLLIHATKIFIGGVPQGTLKDDVEKYFSQYGKVRITVYSSQFLWSKIMIFKNLHKKIVAKA